jgi:hypothetical protein
VSAMLGDYRNAAAQIEYANRLGYASVSSQVALADAAFQTGNAQAGNAALEQGVGLRAKAGQTVDASWYDRAIALSHRNKRPTFSRFGRSASWPLILPRRTGAVLSST